MRLRSGTAPTRSAFHTWLKRRLVPLSEVIDPARHDDPDWAALHRDIESYAVDKHVFRHWSGEVHRKGYEWTQCIFGLEALGAIRPDARALGVGAGHEAVIFWLADHISHVTATDLYGNEKWQSTPGGEGKAEVLVQPQQYCARTINTDKISFQVADGTKLPYPDASFDFCWSLSSIEHFGSHDAAAIAMREMARVTKPGGIVCVATEMLLDDQASHPEFFTARELKRYILRATGDLALVDTMNWNLPPREYLDDPVLLWGEANRLRRHVVMQDGSTRYTSVIAFFRKGERTWADHLRGKMPWAVRSGPTEAVNTGADLEPYSIDHRMVHNQVSCEQTGSKLAFVTPASPWSYAVEMPRRGGIIPEERGMKVSLSARVRNNPAAFGVLKPDGINFIDEREVAPNARPESVTLVIPLGTPAGSLMVRTGAGGSSHVEFEIQSCEPIL